jgi:uncharacterized membrane protein
MFYGEELLASRPTQKLEDHPLSAVCDCLFSIFAATFHIWKLMTKIKMIMIMMVMVVVVVVMIIQFLFICVLPQQPKSQLQSEHE